MIDVLGKSRPCFETIMMKAVMMVKAVVVCCVEIVIMNGKRERYAGRHPLILMSSTGARSVQDVIVPLSIGFVLLNGALKIAFSH
jgi:hypothetical protein